MRLARFELEHFLSAHEHDAKHVLGTSGVASLPKGALAFPSDVDAFDYGPIPAQPRLVRAIALARGVPDDHVVVTVGGTEALFLAAFALVAPGDRVLVESPTYFPVKGVPASLGARVEEVPRRFEEGWRLDVDEFIRRLEGDVALVSVTNPNNPTGQLTPASDLVRLAKACERVGAWLLVDDIFRPCVQPRPPVSHALHPRIVTAESLTKCYGLSGLRVGWLLAVPEVRAKLREAKALTSLVDPAVAQAFALDALRREDALLERTLRITHANLLRFRVFMQQHPALAWREPDCPLVAAVRLPGGTDDVAFCERLLEEEGVLLVPGTYVGIPGFVRVGFGGELDAFRGGLDAFARFLARERDG